MAKTSENEQNQSSDNLVNQDTTAKAEPSEHDEGDCEELTCTSTEGENCLQWETCIKDTGASVTPTYSTVDVVYECDCKTKLVVTDKDEKIIPCNNDISIKDEKEAGENDDKNNATNVKEKSCMKSCHGNQRSYSQYDATNLEVKNFMKCCHDNHRNDFKYEATNSELNYCLKHGCHDNHKTSTDSKYDATRSEVNDHMKCCHDNRTDSKFDDYPKDENRNDSTDLDCWFTDDKLSSVKDCAVGDPAPKHWTKYLHVSEAPVSCSPPIHGCKVTATTVLICFVLTFLVIFNSVLKISKTAQPRKYVNTGQLKRSLVKCFSVLGMERSHLSMVKVERSYAGKNRALELMDCFNLCNRKKHDINQPPFMNVTIVYPLGADLRSFITATGKTVEKMMENEWIRLSTFVGYPTGAPVSAMRLSDAGFYYENSEGDEVKCFKCGIKYKGWRPGDIPILIHKTISPTCEYIRDKSPPTGEEFGPTDSTVQQRTENRIPAINTSSQSSGTEASGGSNDMQLVTSVPKESVETEKSKEKPTASVSQPGTGVASQQAPVAANEANFALTSQSSISSVRATEEGGTAVVQSSEAVVQGSAVVVQGSGAVVQGSAAVVQGSAAVVQGSAAVVQGSGAVVQGSAAVAQSGSTPSIPSALIAEPLGVTTAKPRYPNFAVYVTRLQTFAGFPEDMSQKPEELAKAGFFYEGKNDNVRCFYCGGGLRDWEPEDEPWVEHARWYKKCVYVRQSKGDEFINLVQSGQYEILRREKELKRAAEDKKKNIMQLPAVVSVLEMGYPDNLVKQAYQKCASEHGESNVLADVLLGAVFQLEEEETQSNPGNEAQSTPEDAPAGEPTEQTTPQQPPSETEQENVEDLEEENRILKEQQMCKICMEEEAAIVFLPCGHMVTCVSCAAAMRHCPICRTFIRGTIKAIVC